ncbi:MAG TPA: alpha/beta hydrolase-fold protein [Casimicrobiaceae bacterium]|nr:alpha/beta hydrolase-fold protein [Casimicrobiaceae bacterium]
MLALLSGTYSEPEDFIREGFPAAVHDHGIDAELVMAEMRASWFADGSVVERIRAAVIIPALQRGRSRIWLAGISLGGLATLAYAARHASDIEGILLISPYPATRAVLREMRDAGGMERWKPVIPPGGDLEREAWAWLVESGDGHLPVHCYFGSDDRYAPGQRQMAQVLSPARVCELPGGHDWNAWRTLWAHFLCNSKSTFQ